MTYAIGLFSRLRPDDVVYVTLPIYHSNGGIIAAGQMIVNGCTIVLRRKFSASNFWSDCIKYQCTVSTPLCTYKV